MYIDSAQRILNWNESYWLSVTDWLTDVDSDNYRTSFTDDVILRGAPMVAHWILDSPRLEREWPEKANEEKTSHLWTVMPECFAHSRSEFCIYVVCARVASQLSRIFTVDRSSFVMEVLQKVSGCKSPALPLEISLVRWSISASTSSVGQLVWFSRVVSTFAFFACIGLTLVKNRQESVRTWCPVFDLFPTISTSTGYFYPQAYIWRICIGFTSFPRFLLAILQMQYRLLRPNMLHPRHYIWAERLNGSLHFLELTALLLLSFVSLKETEWVHVYSYFSFAMFSILHMLVTSSIDYLWPRTIFAEITPIESKLRAKRLKLFFLYLVSFWVSMSLYFIHFRVCLTMLYSTHSLLEYVLILTNITYHGLMFEEWDQKGHIHLSW